MFTIVHMGANYNGLEQTIALKQLAQKHNIPFIVGEMDQEKLKWLQLDLELEELEDDERYYELFGVGLK